MLTARGRPEDVLHGFEAGTDDYLAKPFDLDIFLARLKGLLRRRQWLRKENRSTEITSVVTVNGRTIDLENLELRNGEDLIHITLMEAKLLRYLIEHEGRAVSRKVILEEVLGPAKGHGHACHRQFHRSPSPLPRGRAEQSKDRPNRPRHRIQVHSTSGELTRY